MKNNLCAAMIVRNEATIIERSLRSLAPHVSYVVICDTGSTDGTPEIAEKVLRDIGLEGKVARHEWVNFAANRQRSFDESIGHGEYCLHYDADETIDDPLGELQKLPPGFDGFKIVQGDEGLSYTKTRITRNDGSWTWGGAVHEYLNCANESPKLGNLTTKVIHHPDGARNRSGTKFLTDLVVLLQEHQKNPQDARTVFYLAQTLRDLGMTRKAIEAYKIRVSLGGWAEEVYYSLWQIAELEHELNGGDVLKSSEAFLRAYQFRPIRLEALVSLCAKLREAGAYMLSLALLDTAPAEQPTDVLFVDRCAVWRMWEELALSEYYMGDKEGAKRSFEEALTFDLPPTDRTRIEEGLKFCQ